MGTSLEDPKDYYEEYLSTLLPEFKMTSQHIIKKKSNQIKTPNLCLWRANEWALNKIGTKILSPAPAWKGGMDGHRRNNMSH